MELKNNTHFLAYRDGVYTDVVLYQLITGGKWKFYRRRMPWNWEPHVGRQFDTAQAAYDDIVAREYGLVRQ